MVVITIISIDNFLQFVYASILLPSAKLERNFKSFMANHALNNQISDVLFIIRLIILGSRLVKGM